MPKATVSFTCPDCDETFVVDVEMRAALLRSGCVTCGGGVADGAFQPWDKRGHRQRL